MRLSIAALALAGGTIFSGLASGSVFDTHSNPAALAVARAALERTNHRVTYNGAYRSLAYPNGDVPANEGVCTDVVIRTYRALGIDLQQLVHDDMKANFSAYPNRWGLSRPDSNIDHRRVPNLETFFARAAAQSDSHNDANSAPNTSPDTASNKRVTAQSFPPSNDATNYLPGDVVSWRLPNGLPHIGMVVASRLGPHPSDRYAIVHNIGLGPELEDVLFSWKITGHYRFLPNEF